MSQFSMFPEVSKETRAKIQALADQMLLDARTSGIGFDEVRQAAEHRGWLSGHENGRTLSFGSAVMRAAGGTVVRYRPSRCKNAHGRRIAIYVHEMYLEELAQRA